MHAPRKDGRQWAKHAFSTKVLDEHSEIVRVSAPCQFKKQRSSKMKGQLDRKLCHPMIFWLRHPITGHLIQSPIWTLWPSHGKLTHQYNSTIISSDAGNCDPISFVYLSFQLRNHIFTCSKWFMSLPHPIPIISHLSEALIGADRQRKLRRFQWATRGGSAASPERPAPTEPPRRRKIRKIRFV